MEMRRFYSFFVGLFLLSVRAEKEDFQGSLTKQTKGTPVTGDVLLRKENRIGHGTEAIPEENLHQHTAVAVTAKFPGAVLFDRRPTATQNTKVAATVAPSSGERFVFRNGHDYTAILGHNPSAMRIHTGSEESLISYNEKIVFSSTQAAFQSMMNGTHQPEVRLSADAVKAPLLLHTLLDNRHQRNMDSITLTPGDRGPSEPILSASSPVIDNLAGQRNGNDDKRSPGEDEKEISNLGRHEYELDMMQSIIQSDTEEDSVRGNPGITQCLTCKEDGRAASSERSVALSIISPHGSSNSLPTDGLALDFNQFTASLHSLNQQSAGEQEDTVDKEISYQNMHRHSSFSVTEQLSHNLKFPALSFNETINQSISNDSQIKYSHSDTRGAALQTRAVAEVSLVTQKDTRKQSRQAYFRDSSVTERPISAISVLHGSSKLLNTFKKPLTKGEKEMFGTQVAIGDTQLLKERNGENSSHSFSTAFKNFFLHIERLGFSNDSVSRTPIISDAPDSSMKRVPPGGNDHSRASHTAVKMTSRDAHRGITSVGNPEPPTTTERVASLFSELRSQTPANSRSPTKEPISPFLLLKDSRNMFGSIVTKSQLMDEQDSLTLNTINSSITLPSVDPSGSVMRNQQMPFSTTGKHVTSEKLFPSEPRQNFYNNVFVWTPITPSSKLFSKKPTTGSVLGVVSENMQRRISGVSSGYHIEPTRQSVVIYNTDLVNDTLGVHNPLLAEGEDKEIIKTQTEEIKETQEMLQLQGKERTEQDGKLDNKSKALFLSDNLEDREQDTIITSRVQITQNTDQGEGEINQREINTNRKEGSTREKTVTLRQNKGLRPWEVRGEESAERKGVTEINIQLLTKDVAKKQRESLTMEGVMEIAHEKDVKDKREIGQEGRTNIPLGPNTNSQDVNNDKGRRVTSLPSCNSLIKQLGATEHKVIHLSENTAQMKNKPFTYEVTGSYAQLHSALMSQSPKTSGKTSFPKEPFTEIKPHPSTSRAVLKKHASMSSLTKESDQNKALKQIFSVTAKPKAPLKLAHTFGISTATVSPHSSTHKSAPPVPNSGMLSINVPCSRLTPSFLQTQPHFSVNSSFLSVSIIQRILCERQKFSTPGLKTNLPLQTTDERVQAEHITQATLTESSVKGPLTSTMIEGVNESMSVTSAQMQMQNDSSTRTPTATALSSEDLDSIDHLHPHQGQSVTQKPLPFSFDMITGQPCSCNLSERRARSDTSHAFVDDNKHRSVQAQMSSVSPETRSNQFSFSSTSPLLNPMLLGSDSLPRTLSLMGLTTLASGRDAEYGNNRGGSVKSLVAAVVETNIAEENNGVQMMATLVTKYSDEVTKIRTENTDKKDVYSFVAQPIGRHKHNRSNSDEFDSWAVKQTDKLAVKHTNENNHNDLPSVEAIRVKAALENNPPFQLGGHDETTATPFMLAGRTTRKIEQTTSEDLEPVLSDSTTSVGGTNDPTGHTSDHTPEISIFQANDVSNSTISDGQRPAGKYIEKQHDPATPQESMVDEAFHLPHINFRSDLRVPIISTRQIADPIMAVTSEFQITSTKTNDFVSVTPADSKSGLILSPVARESALTASERVPVVTEKSSDTGNAESLLQFNNQTKPKTTTSGKLTSALEKKNVTEPRYVEQPEWEIPMQVIKQSQHALPGMSAITNPISNPQRGVQADFLSRAGVAATAVKIVNYFSYEDLKKSIKAKSAALDAKHLPHANPQLDTRVQHEENASVGVLSNSDSPMGIVLTEINNGTRRGTTCCANLGEITKTIEAGEIDHLAQEKVHKTQTANTGRDHPSASEMQGTGLENPEGSTDCSVPGKATPEVDITVHASLSSAFTESYDFVDGTMTSNVNSMNYETSTWRVAVESDYLDGQGTLERTEIVEQTTQRRSHRETSYTTEVTPSEPAATSEKAIEQILPTEKNTKLHFKRGARADLFVAQKSTRSEETALTKSKHRLLLPEQASESEQPRLKQRRRSSPHLYLSGVTEVSDDLCGTGNYTAEMSLNLGRDLQPGDAVPVLGNLRVVINLKTNNSLLTLWVTSCCLSATIQPDLPNSTCCLFSRLAAEPAGITLLPTSLPTSASFTISLFQMINYSVVYLHCDLSVCPRNRSDCERQCLQQRSVYPFEGPQAVVTNLRNRISFGPVLKEVKNSTFPEELDPAELDLVLVIVSLVVGFSVVTVLLLLVWLAYRHRVIRLLPSAAPPAACCCCLRPEGDLILP